MERLLLLLVFYPLYLPLKRMGNILLCHVISMNFVKA